ncbi:MAG: DUF5686 and carboxypeptidase regulatory-like domain-containing protein [Bacteroidia bacterium]|nr:DUF5686 and carboxypeptidase regulatory-like domain-containing protein [Bacteroidia bacterium]
MKQFLRIFVPTCFLSLFLFSFSTARMITGQVNDENNQPVPFASVFIKGTSSGTTSNSEGIYKLTVPEKSFTLVVKHIGYKSEEKRIDPGTGNLQINFILKAESYSLGEVVIKAGEDPAYQVMRNAIARRKFYRYQVESYQCAAYIKGVQRLLKWPEKILGQPVLVSSFIDTCTKIIYLSESISDFYYQKPDQFYEEMISSKVSGSSQAFSWNSAMDLQFNFYDALIKRGIAPRGLISPLSPSSFFYYQFRHEGTFIENGILIHKIAVIPKRKNDPVFSGSIFIQENSWRLHAVDLLVTRNAQLQFIDSLSLKQVFISITEDVWLPVTSSFSFSYRILGFEGNGNFTGTFSDYQVNPDLPEKLFKGPLMKIREESNKRNSVYWDQVRPVPLTEIEKHDYIIKDSLQSIRHSKAFLDSVDRETNRFTLAKILLTGYNYHNRFKHVTCSFTPLTENVLFNTVEGLAVGLNMSVRYVLDTLYNTNLVIDPYLQYNFSSENLYATLKASWSYNTLKSAIWFVEGGIRSFQFNPENPIHPFINTDYVLFGGKNYMKLYLSRFGRSGWKSEVTNGIFANATVEFHERKRLENSTSYSFINESKRDVTPNNPTLTGSPASKMEDHAALLSKFKLTLKPGQSYLERPYSKIVINQKLPVFFLEYQKAWNLGLRFSDFQLAFLGISHSFTVGLLGTSELEAVGGKFFTVKNIYLPDYRHFNANLTFFSKFSLRRFDLLDYYSNSTRDRFAEFHAQHNFKGFILNKIPVLRKLKLEEIVSFHYLNVRGRNNHYELSVGISKLGFIRCDYVMAFERTTSTRYAFRLALIGLN